MIWCVEDDASIRDIEVYTLNSTGFEAKGVADGDAFRAALREQKPELVLLDVMLPGEDGVSLLQFLKSSPETAEIPVIMATAKGMEYDKIQSLDLGADDYLVKPFSMKELDARLRALVRRARGRQTRSVLCWEDIELDPAAHSATRSGVPLRLSPTGFVILETLLRAAPAVVPRTELEQAIWGDFPPDSDALRTHIHELRQKLDKPFTCPLLKTIPHVGYTLVRHE